MLEAPWNKLHIDKDLACEFLGVFSRYEYALKAAGFARGDNYSVKPNWEGFSNTISEQFNASANLELFNAVTYLTSYPPRKQILGRNSWTNLTFNNNVSQVEQLLLCVRTIRNNLFHGGKFIPQPIGELNRDFQLVNSALIILSYCITLEQRVEQEFNS